MNSYTTRYKHQHYSAFFLLVLIPWLLTILFRICHLGYDDTLHIFQKPFNALCTFLLLITGFYHGYLGLQTICIDYISNPKLRQTILNTVAIILLLVTTLGCLCLLKILHIMDM